MVAGTSSDVLRTVPRPRTFACLFGGHVIGGSVAVVVLQAPWLWLAVLASGLIAGIIGLRWRTVRQDDPSWTEILVAMGGVVLSGLAVAFIAICSFLVMYGVTWTIGQLEWAQPDPAIWGWWAAAVATVIFPKLTEETLDLLFPTVTPFDLPLRQREVDGGWLWWLGFSSSVAVIAAVAAVFGMESLTTQIVWPLVVLWAASATTPQTPRFEQNDRYDEIVERLASALSGDGYDVVVNPVTNDADVDRALVDTDIMATAAERPSLLVDVRLECGPMNWHDATPIVTAATVCEHWLDDGSEVHPLLVLVDSEADDSVAKLLGNTGLCVIEYHTETGALTVVPEVPHLGHIVAGALAGLGTPSDDGAKQVDHG